VTCTHPSECVTVQAVKRRPDQRSDITLRCDDCGHLSSVIGFAPQPGPQTQYFACTADIAFYGGAAGGGKTCSIVVEPARYFDVRDFNGIIFRRTTTQLTGKGGIWDESIQHYPHFGGIARAHRLEWEFRAGAAMKFSHLQHEDDKLSHQGKPYTFIGFDEVTHFTESQFWYLQSRSRSLCGVRPYTRATCNPVDSEDPVGGWVRTMVDWWIDPKTGLVIPERSGVVRYFVRYDERLVWADDPAELRERFDPAVYGDPKSFTFIAARLEDNQILMEADPAYLANLMALPRVERERLRWANWNSRPAAGLYFQRSWFRIADKAPNKFARVVRGWDLAASKPTPENPDPDWTRGVKWGVDHKGQLWILDMVSLRGSPGQNRELRKATAKLDGHACTQCFWQDPGQAGKDQVDYIRNELIGYRVSLEVARENKLTYLGPVSSAAEAGRVTLLAGEWNAPLLSEVEAIPEGKHDDIGDAMSRGFKEIDRAAVDLYTKAMANT
jgi:predicted phage terminase large subunit-like protein